nr:hypothetical protein CFP56_20241 [Quercus suber]
MGFPTRQITKAITLLLVSMRASAISIPEPTVAPRALGDTFTTVVSNTPYTFTTFSLTSNTYGTAVESVADAAEESANAIIQATPSINAAEGSTAVTTNGIETAAVVIALAPVAFAAIGSDQWDQLLQIALADDDAEEYFERIVYKISQNDTSVGSIEIDTIINDDP